MEHGISQRAREHMLSNVRLEIYWMLGFEVHVKL